MNQDMALSPRLCEWRLGLCLVVIKHIFFLGVLYWHNYESHVHSVAWRSAFTWPAMPCTQCHICWGWRWSDPYHNTAWLVWLLWRIDHQRCFEHRNSSSLYPLGKPTLHSLKLPQLSCGLSFVWGCNLCPKSALLLSTGFSWNRDKLQLQPCMLVWVSDP